MHSEHRPTPGPVVQTCNLKYFPCWSSSQTLSRVVQTCKLKYFPCWTSSQTLNRVVQTCKLKYFPCWTSSQILNRVVQTWKLKYISRWTVILPICPLKLYSFVYGYQFSILDCSFCPINYCDDVVTLWHCCIYIHTNRKDSSTDMVVFLEAWCSQTAMMMFEQKVYRFRKHDASYDNYQDLVAVLNSWCSHKSYSKHLYLFFNDLNTP